MGFFNRTTLQLVRVEGNGAWQQVLPADPTRRSLIICSQSPNAGSIDISFAGGADANALNMLNTEKWELCVAPTNALHFKVAATDYIVVYVDGNNVP